MLDYIMAEQEWFLVTARIVLMICLGKLATVVYNEFFNKKGK